MIKDEQDAKVVMMETGFYPFDQIQKSWKVCQKFLSAPSETAKKRNMEYWIPFVVCFVSLNTRECLEDFSKFISLLEQYEIRDWKEDVIHHAIRTGCNPILEMLQAGEYLDKEDESLCEYACKYGRRIVLKWLVESGYECPYRSLKKHYCHYDFYKDAQIIMENEA